MCELENLTSDGDTVSYKYLQRFVFIYSLLFITKEITNIDKEYKLLHAYREM